MLGFLVVDKPSGPTSHDVVAAVRRATGIKKVGHAGTLDPMATGVVVVALGRATRLIRFVQDTPKEYVATARFGEQTDTLDADGAILGREPMDVDHADVARAAERFVGEILQVPPMVSALKVGGKRLYQLAREGVEVEREPRPVTIHELEIIDVGPPPYPEVEMRVVCGKGTYVRTLADDIARALGGVAHLTALRRTSVGALTLDQAVPLDEVDRRWEAAVVPAAVALRHLPSVLVDDETVASVSHGARLAQRLDPGIENDQPYLVVDGEDRLIAVYRNAGHGSRAEVVLA